MTTRQFDRIYIFEEVGNAENKYVFTAPFMSAIELYTLFLKWCGKVNYNIEGDIEDHELDVKMTTIMDELFSSSDLDNVSAVPMVIGNSVYVGTMDFINNPHETDTMTPYFRGELSVRPIHTLKEPNDIKHEYQFSLVLVKDIADGFED
jgi:hypothetical protein